MPSLLATTMEGDKRPWTQRLFLAGIGLTACLGTLALLFLLKKFICCCCRRRSPGGSEEAQQRPTQVTCQAVAEPLSVSHLIQKKELCTTYLICICGGVFGAHHFYLDRPVHGVVCLWTLNFCMFGWCFDLLMVPVYVRRHNQRAATVAPSDGSCRSASWRLVLTYVVGIVALMAALVHLPRTLHDLGVMDIDMKMAGTEENPYVLLGVERGCSPTKAFLAYGEQVQRLNPAGRPCLGPCRAKLDDLQRAADFARGGWRGPQRAGHQEEPDDWANWDDWADFIALEWEHLLATAQDALRDPKDPDAPPPKERHRGPGGAARGERRYAAGHASGDL